jgi:hypothetical protein
LFHFHFHFQQVGGRIARPEPRAYRIDTAQYAVPPSPNRPLAVTRQVTS